MSSFLSTLREVTRLTLWAVCVLGAVISISVYTTGGFPAWPALEWLGISIPAPVGPYLHAALLGLVLVFPYFVVPVAVVIVLVALTTEGLKRLRKGQ